MFHAWMLSDHETTFYSLTSNTTLGTISLEGLEFFAYHGFYDEEQKVGNKYSLDITIHTDRKSVV